MPNIQPTHVRGQRRLPPDPCLTSHHLSDCKHSTSTTELMVMDKMMGNDGRNHPMWYTIRVQYVPREMSTTLEISLAAHHSAHLYADCPVVT